MSQKCSLTHSTLIPVRISLVSAGTGNESVFCLCEWIKLAVNVNVLQVTVVQSSMGNLEKAAEHHTISDIRALKCWMASSLLCCSLSRSISLVCSDRAFCTSRSLSLRLASIRACRSNSRSFSMSTFCRG